MAGPPARPSASSPTGFRNEPIGPRRPPPRCTRPTHRHSHRAVGRGHGLSAIITAAMLSERIQRRIAFAAFALLAAALMACRGGEEAPEAAESVAEATPSPRPTQAATSSTPVPTAEPINSEPQDYADALVAGYEAGADSFSTAAGARCFADALTARLGGARLRAFGAPEDFAREFDDLSNAIARLALSNLLSDAASLDLTLVRIECEPGEYARASGPVVLFDEAHNNIHTVDGTYATFVRILRADGYVVRSSTSPFRHAILEQGRILVIVNALNERNITDWSLPTPSAFTKSEIEAVADWVYGGGSLFLIADHMPFGGAASDLANRFGIEFTNSFDVDADAIVAEITPRRLPGPAIFSRSVGNLLSHTVTDGRGPQERVNSVATFVGQGFNVPDLADVLLRFDVDRKLLFPTEAWVFSDATPSRPAAGMAQAAVIRFGQGRVAVFGEAAMFRARGIEQALFGLNSDKAEDNVQLLLNVMHWLDGTLERKAGD